MFGMLRKTRTDSIPHGSKKREEAFTSMKQHSVGRYMVVLKLFRSDEFDTPYAYCEEEVAYVRHLHVLIHACEVGENGDVERAPLLQRVLLDCTRCGDGSSSTVTTTSARECVRRELFKSRG